MSQLPLGTVQVQGTNLFKDDKSILFGTSKTDFNARIFNTDSNLQFKTYKDNSGISFETGSGGFSVDTTLGANNTEANGGINFKANNNSSFLVKNGDLKFSTENGKLFVSSSDELNVSSGNDTNINAKNLNIDIQKDTNLKTTEIFNISSQTTNITNDEINIKTKNKTSIETNEFKLKFSKTSLEGDSVDIKSTSSFNLESKEINIGTGDSSQDILIGNYNTKTYINGDLIVNGTHTVVNSSQVFMSDNFSLLNSDSDSMPNKSGMFIDRTFERLNNDDADIKSHYSGFQNKFSENEIFLSDSDTDDYKNWIIKIDSGPFAGQYKNVKEVNNKLLKTTENWTPVELQGSNFKVTSGVLTATGSNFTSSLSKGCSVKCDHKEFVISDINDDNTATITDLTQNLDTVSVVNITSPGFNTIYSLYKRSVVGNVYSETENRITFGQYRDLNDPQLEKLTNIKADNATLSTANISNTGKDRTPIVINQNNTNRDITGMIINQNNKSSSFLTVEGSSEGGNMDNNIVNFDSGYTYEQNCFLAIDVKDSSTGQMKRLYLVANELSE